MTGRSPLRGLCSDCVQFSQSGLARLSWPSNADRSHRKTRVRYYRFFTCSFVTALIHNEVDMRSSDSSIPCNNYYCSENPPDAPSKRHTQAQLQPLILQRYVSYRSVCVLRTHHRVSLEVNASFPMTPSSARTRTPAPKTSPNTILMESFETLKTLAQRDNIRKIYKVF